MLTINYSWDNSLDKRFKIIGFRNGLPIIEWQTEEIPNNLIKAILDYERMHLL